VGLFGLALLDEEEFWLLLAGFCKAKLESTKADMTTNNLARFNSWLLGSG
jgi:hypothetical protein